MEHLIDIVLHRGNTAERLVGAAVTRERALGQAPARRPDAEVLRPAFDAPPADTLAADAPPADRPARAEAAQPDAVAGASGARIVPRRVRAKDGAAKSPRPSRPEAAAMIFPSDSGAA